MAISGSPAKSNSPIKNKRGLASTAAVRIVQVAVREGVSVAELTQLAEADPAFTMRLLALVNSPAFSTSRKITDVRQASSLLGIRGLRTVALSLVVSDLSPAGKEGALLLSNAIRRALTARALAEYAKYREADSCFTVGLLLEAGLLVWSRTAPEDAAEVARSPAAHRVLREEASGHTPHPISGGKLAREYHLPEEMVYAIEHHHDASLPKGELAAIAWVAEQVAAVFEGAPVDVQRNVAIAAAAQIGVSAEQIETLLAELPQKVTEQGAAFDRDIGPQLDLQKLRDDANTRLVEMNQQYEEIVQTLKKVLAEKSDLTRRLQLANESLSRLAATDALTSLPNRRAMEESLQRDLARAFRENKPLSVVILDVDHFKKFNDAHGHLGGDEALRSVGETLRGCLREGDLAARYGGEEFVMILPLADEVGARIVAERVRLALETTPVQFNGQALRLTASFGVATTWPATQAEAVPHLFERADAALYKAKESGRNRVVLAQSVSPAAA